MTCVLAVVFAKVEEAAFADYKLVARSSCRMLHRLQVEPQQSEGLVDGIAMFLGCAVSL